MGRVGQRDVSTSLRYDSHMYGAAIARMSEEEYLAYDHAHEGKHEFVHGDVIAMAGVSAAHDSICANLMVAFGTRLRGTGCRVHTADLRVRIGETGMYAYPDATIHCGRAEFAPTQPETLLNPRFVFEVLSESTADYDLGAKAAHYRQRESVEAIILIDSRRRAVQTQTRNLDGTWLLSDFSEGSLRLSGIDTVVPLDELYEAVQWA